MDILAHARRNVDRIIGGGALRPATSMPVLRCSTWLFLSWVRDAPPIGAFTTTSEPTAAARQAGAKITPSRVTPRGSMYVSVQKPAQNKASARGAGICHGKISSC
ncbi:MAG TPA: hypothetical protein VK601_28860 [Kofleriaceae bacterium]|nr:hypothetical protein [Kofleriaceae bacterium]